MGNTAIVKARDAKLDVWDFGLKQTGPIVVRVNSKELLHETVMVVFELVMGARPRTRVG